MCGKLRRFRKRCEMPHLTPRAGLDFTVEVKLHIGQRAGRSPAGLPCLPQIPEQIGHGSSCDEFGRAQRQTAYGAQLLFELTRVRSVDRQVPGVMRSGRELVD